MMKLKHGLAFVLIPAVCATAFAAEPEIPVRTIAVSGTAVTRTVPDIVAWDISTSDFNKNLLVAKRSSDEKIKAIMGIIRELEVEPTDIQTGQVRVRREYYRDEKGNRTEFKHFAVTRKITLKQHDLKRFDEFFSKLISSAEVEVDFSFESSRFHELRAETRLKAMRIAKEKAKALTGQVDAKLGKVLTIVESIPPGEGRSSRGVFVSNNEIFVDSGSGSPDDISEGTFAPGAIEVRVSIYATFEIE